MAPLTFIGNNILSKVSQGVTELMEYQDRNLYIFKDMLAANYPPYQAHNRITNAIKAASSIGWDFALWLSPASRPFFFLTVVNK